MKIDERVVSMERKLLPERCLRDWQVQIMREGSPKVLVIWDGYKAVPQIKRARLIDRIRNRIMRFRAR